MCDTRGGRDGNTHSFVIRRKVEVNEAEYQMICDAHLHNSQTRQRRLSHGRVQFWRRGDGAPDILHRPLSPPSSSLQPRLLINADIQLAQAQITNLFHSSSIPLMTPVGPATYLHPRPHQTRVSSFPCLEPGLMQQQSGGR